MNGDETASASVYWKSPTNTGNSAGVISDERSETNGSIQTRRRVVVQVQLERRHGPGQHEYRAGLLLFQKCLAGYPGLKVEVYSNDWPASSDVLKGAAAVVLYTVVA